MKTLTLNIINGKEFILAPLSEEHYTTLLAFAVLTAEDKKKNDNTVADILRLYKIVSYTDIVSIAGDREYGPIFDNTGFSRIIPKTTINTKSNYYCYAGYDYQIKHANTIMHEDPSSALNCALGCLGTNQFVIVYSVPTTKENWSIHIEKNNEI